MATIWITYSWEDNKNQDVDYVAQELEKTGLKVKMDKWEIRAGERLWSQIEKFIQDKSECDAWMIYATNNSLGSEPCKEEFAYALDRALNSRGLTFPVIGLFPSSVDQSLIPAGIRTRLYVSVTDPDWKERVVAAAEGRTLAIPRANVDPFYIKVHDHPLSPGKFVIEIRPRGGTWSPFAVGIPISEKDAIQPGILRSASGVVPRGGGVLHSSGADISTDGLWWVLYAQDEATPSQSYYLFCYVVPSKITFGVLERGPNYTVNFSTV